LDYRKLEAFYHLVLHKPLVALLALALDVLVLTMHHLWPWPWQGGLDLDKVAFTLALVALDLTLLAL